VKANPTAAQIKPATSIDEPLLTVEDAQAILRVDSDQIVYRMIKQRVIPPECIMRMGPRRIRIRKQLLMDWINGSEPKEAA
jgi:hypothetical protein